MFNFIFWVIFLLENAIKIVSLRTANGSCTLSIEEEIPDYKWNILCVLQVPSANWHVIQLEMMWEVKFCCWQDSAVQSGADQSSVVLAKHFCLNCSENLCDKCYAMHSRIRSSRHHRVVQLGTELTAQDLRGPVAQCDQHVDEQVKMFCSDCVSCICFLCYAEFHTGHRCQVLSPSLAYVTASAFALPASVAEIWVNWTH